MAGAERDDSDKGVVRGEGAAGNEGDRAGWNREKERKCNGAESRTRRRSRPSIGWPKGW